MSEATAAKGRSPRRFRVLRLAMILLICCGVGLFAGDLQLNNSYLTGWLSEQASAAGAEWYSRNMTWSNSFDLAAAALVGSTSRKGDDDDDRGKDGDGKDEKKKENKDHAVDKNDEEKDDQNDDNKKKDDDKNNSHDDDDDDDDNDDNDDDDDKKKKKEKEKEKKKDDKETEKKEEQEQEQEKTIRTSETGQRVQQAIDDLRSEFHERYGPDAEKMLQVGIYWLEDAHGNLGCLNHTARRILQRHLSSSSSSSLSSRDELVPFVWGVSGYSIAVARGNFFRQAYSFVAADLLKEMFAHLGLDLQVRNHGIGGIPSFPHGWCLPQFLGRQVDVLFWDYRINEMGPNFDATLEAYVRNLVSFQQWAAPPLFVLMDWTPREESKLKVLQHYVGLGVLPDAVGIAFSATALKASSYGSEEGLVEVAVNYSSSLPAGFQNWTEWGSPHGTPGQAIWHLRYRQHEMAGWFVAMYFTNVLELVLTLLESEEEEEDLELPMKKDDDDNGLVALPSPFTDRFSKDEGTQVRSMTYGIPVTADKWFLPPVSCYTTFEPLVSGRLDQLVVSGLVTGQEKDDDEFDILPHRHGELYNSSWVVDLSHFERAAKTQTANLNLGYIDAKVALSGVSASGPLQLWIPVEADDATPKTRVKDVLETVVVCEVNEAQGRSGNPCQMTRDVTYHLSGENVTNVWQVESVAHYPYQGQICVSLEIPRQALLQRRADVEFEFTQHWQTTIDVGENEQQEKTAASEWGTVLQLEVTRPDLATTLTERPCTVSQIMTQAKMDRRAERKEKDETREKK